MSGHCIDLGSPIPCLTGPIWRLLLTWWGHDSLARVNVHFGASVSLSRCASILCVPLILACILVTRRTSQFYSWCLLQQPDGNSSRSREKECRPSGGLGRMVADPIRGSRDGGSPVSWVVVERERRERGSSTGGHDTHDGKEGERRRCRGGAESIWFGASRASFLACSIPGDQHHGVSFHPQPTSTSLQQTPQPAPQLFNKSLLNKER